MKVPHNPQFEGSAEERRSSVPVALRAPAPPQPQRWASLPRWVVNAGDGILVSMGWLGDDTRI